MLKRIALMLAVFPLNWVFQHFCWINRPNIFFYFFFFKFLKLHTEMISPAFDLTDRKNALLIQFTRIRGLDVIAAFYHSITYRIYIEFTHKNYTISACVCAFYGQLCSFLRTKARIILCEYVIEIKNSLVALTIKKMTGTIIY